MKLFKLSVVTSVLVCNLISETLMLETISVEDNGINDEIKNKQVTVKEVGVSNNIADFLSNDSEVTLSRRAAYGDSGDTLLIRGQGGNRIAVNIDGHNINSLGGVGGNYIDFGTIPMDNIEKIEVIKGGSSVEYGNVLGGVINAYTKKPEEKTFFNFYSTVGGWDHINDYSNIRAGFSKRFGDFGITIGASHQEADAYLWNNDYESDSISTRLYYFLPNEGEISVGLIYSNTTRNLIKSNRQSTDPTNSLYDVPYTTEYPTSLGETFAGASGANRAFSNIGKNAYWEKKKYLYDIKYEQPINDNIIIEVNAYKNSEDRKERNFADTSLVYGTSLQDGDLVLERELEVDKSYGYKGKGRIFLENNELLIGVEKKVLRSGDNTITYLNTEYNGNAGGPSNKNGSVGIPSKGTRIDLDSLFLSDTIDLSEDMKISLGARYDKYSIDMPKNGVTYSEEENKITPKLGFTYIPSHRDAFGIYLYQMFRAPGSPEANHYIDGVNAYAELAEKSLEAEKANAIDIVYKHNFGNNASIQSSIFYYDVDDYIVFKSPSTGGRYAYNVDNAEFFGISLSGNYKLNDSFLVKSGITYQRAKKEGDVLDPNNTFNKIDYIPDYKLTAGIEWKIFPKLKSDIQLTYVGKRYYQRTIDDLEKLDSYITMDASLQYKVTKNSFVELYAQNLADEHYEEVFGYPSTQRNIGVSFKYVY